MSVRRFIASLTKKSIGWVAALAAAGLGAPGAEAQAPPAGYNQLQTNYVLRNTDPGGWAGSGNGSLEVSSSSSLPLDTSVTHNGLPSLRVNVTATPDWWTAMIVPRGWATADISDYWANGRLEFNVRGNAGGEVFLFGVGDRATERSINGTPTESYKIKRPITDFLPGGVTTSWQHVSIPVKDLIPSGSPFVLKDLWMIELSNANSNTMRFWLNEIKFTSPDRERSYPKMKVNQIGYTTGAEKYVTVSGWYEDMTSYTTGTAFQVRRASDGVAVYNGTLTLITDYEPAVSGEKILRGDFSSLTTAGTYYVTVSGVPNSYNFKIGNDAYDALLRNIQRYFYLQRANMNLVEPYAEGWAINAVHADDFNCPLESNASIKKNVSAGWYDAGDSGKYVSPGATAVNDLLWAYETFPSIFADGQLNIPESSNGRPDILDEAKYELDFLLRMQDSASGGFWSRVFPQDRSSPRYISDIVGSLTQVKPTAHSASTVAVLAHAYVVYSPIDSTFANTCLTAAQNGWTYLQNNSSVVPSPSGPYNDNEDASDRFWAAAELYRATGQSTYHNYFLANYQNFSSVFSETENAHGVGGMALSAYLTYLKSSNRNATAVTWITNNFNTWRGYQISRGNGPWRNSNADADYYWGSNMPILNTTMDLVIGSKILGTYDADVIKLARSNLNYVLGINPMSYCFVSGHGTNNHVSVYSNIYSADGRTGVPPGYFSGGANMYEGRWFSKFNGKCYVDSTSEWTTNEHTIYWNSPLVFSVALAKAEASTGVVTPPPTPTGLAATPGDGQVALSWNASSGATSYNVKRSTTSGGPYTTVASPTSTSHTNTGLTNGTTYYYVVSAVNSGGESGNSSQVSATPMGGQVAAPTFSPTAGTYTSAQSVTISTTTSGASIRYTTDGSNPTSTTGTLYSGPVSISTTTTLKAIAYKSGMTDSSVTSGVYTIEAGSGGTANIAAGTAVIDATVESAWSNATAYSVSNITGTISGTSDNSGTFKGLWDSTNLYVLAEVTDDNKSNDSTDPWQDDSVEVYVDGGNEKATSYDANDRQYVFGWGDTTVVEAAGRSSTGVTFAKADPTSATYRIELKVPWSTLGVTKSAGQSVGLDVHFNDDDAGGTREGKRQWNDIADTAWNNPSVFGTGSLQAGGSPPPTPTGLSATAGNAQVALSWNASTGATSYNLKRSTTSGSGYSTVASPTTTSHTDTNLTNGTTYYYVVSAVNSQGESANSSQVSATPTGGGGSAPTFQAAGSAASGTGAITPAWPAHQAGDVALLIVESANQTISLSTPAGFAEVTGSPQGTGTAGGTAATRLAVYWKRAASSAEANPTVADSGDHTTARIVTFRGVISSGNPWDVTAGNVASSASTSVSIPGATTTVDNTLVVAIVANATDTTSARTSGWTNSNLTGLTERADHNTSSGNGGGFGVATGVKATSGAYGATTATLATSSVQARLSIALKPGSGGGPALYIYDDTLASDWANWSWNTTVNLSNTSPVQAGSNSISATYTAAWAGLSLRKGTALSTSGYSAIKFWVHGGSGSNKSVNFYSQTEDGAGNSPSVNFTATAGTWTEITIPMSSLGNPSVIKRVNFQEASGAAQTAIYFDEIRLVP